MKTTIEVVGFPELVLERAVKAGIARSKTDAIRLGVLSLNSQYSLVSGADELAVAKMMKAEGNNKLAGRQPKTKTEVLKQYPELAKRARK